MISEIFGWIIVTILMIFYCLMDLLGNYSYGSINKAAINKTGGSNDKTKATRLPTGLFIFRRDLRIIDNTALNLMKSLGIPIIGIFVFNDKQITGSNEYRSMRSLNSMVESLKELAADIKLTGGFLNILHGDVLSIVGDLIPKYNITTVGFNNDYTPFAKARDDSIRSLCEKSGVEVISSHDCLLLGDLTINLPPYKVFTPFYNKYSAPDTLKKIPSPDKTPFKLADVKLEGQFDMTKLSKEVSNEDDNESDKDKKQRTVLAAGRAAALSILKSVAEGKWSNYEDNKNLLTHNNTQLSVHNKFGTVSIREVYAVAKKGNHDGGIIRQLFWRDFYYNLMNSDPNALAGDYNDHSAGKGVKKTDKGGKEADGKEDVKKTDGKNNYWKDPAEGNHFELWKQGKTGFPIVDAGMRELAETGIMHNRARLICADFLVKLLRIDWRLGEKHFARNLIDYDPTQNNYNWQWVAGTGPFSQPKFRVFNPARQSEKYDPKCEYIRKWVPELRSVPDDDLIHNWTGDKKIDYPAPIINYTKAKAEYLKLI